MPKWILPSKYIMFFVPPIMDGHLENIEKCCMKSNESPTKTHVDLEDTSNVYRSAQMQWPPLLASTHTKWKGEPLTINILRHICVHLCGGPFNRRCSRLRMADCNRRRLRSHCRRHDSTTISTTPENHERPKPQKQRWKRWRQKEL